LKGTIGDLVPLETQYSSGEVRKERPGTRVMTCTYRICEKIRRRVGGRRS
jgi:hypothetical protein